jgi:hypothetical protein
MFTERSDYTVNGLGERGTLVAERFEYNSETNDRFSGPCGELRALNEAVERSAQPRHAALAAEIQTDIARNGMVKAQNGTEARHRHGAVRA